MKENMPPECNALWEICRKKSLLRIDKQKNNTHTKKFYKKDQKFYESDWRVFLVFFLPQMGKQGASSRPLRNRPLSGFTTYPT